MCFVKLYTISPKPETDVFPHDHPKLVQMVPRMVPVVMASPPSVMASPPTRPAAPPEIVQEKHEAVTIEREVPVFNEISVQSEKLVEKFEEETKVKKDSLIIVV